MSEEKERHISRGSGEEDVAARQAFIEEMGTGIEWIKKDPYPGEVVKGNIENYIGTARVPIGLAGPLLIHGDHARGEFCTYPSPPPRARWSRPITGACG